MHTLRPHQEQALAYAKNRSRIFLAMEMRTGKTPVTIRWAKARKLRRVLVIAPLSTINPGWVEELQEEMIPNNEIFVLSETPKKQRLDTVHRHRRGWFLVNYEYVRGYPEILELLDNDRDGVVLDESTRIRSPKAQVTKAIIDNTHTEHRALLSGMPNPENASNWFEQMRFMNGDFLGFTLFWKFRNIMYRQPWPGSYEWKPKKGAMEKIKEEVHRHVFVMSAKKAGMNNTHVYEKRRVEMNPLQRRLTKSIVHDFEYGDVETKWAPVQQTWLARIAGGFSPDGKDLVSDAKLKEILSILKEDLPKDAQVVVWARFITEIKAIRQFLNSKGIATAQMTGATSRKKRAIRIKKFQRGEYRVIVIQEKLGMFGLNLATADTDIYYSNMWDNEVRVQCEKRTEHLTKKVPLLHIDLITRDSVDEEVVPRLREKKRIAKSFHLILKGMQDRWKRIYPHLD